MSRTATNVIGNAVAPTVMRGGKKGLTRHRDQMQEEYAAIRDGLLWAGTRWSPTSAKSWLKGTGNRLVLLKLRATEERPDRAGAGRVYPKSTGAESTKETICGGWGRGAIEAGPSDEDQSWPSCLSPNTMCKRPFRENGFGNVFRESAVPEIKRAHQSTLADLPSFSLGNTGGARPVVLKLAPLV